MRRRFKKRNWDDPKAVQMRQTLRHMNEISAEFNRMREGWRPDAETLQRWRDEAEAALADQGGER